MTISNYHLEEPFEPMPFLDWAVLHVEKSLAEVERCERHGVVLVHVDGKPECAGCMHGVRPVRP